ncbi:MAG: hypothetical protein C0507_21565, partial [Cyanobacteria bacterium PR.3.49]|nr:hypothetical protein [Cyanobacteria bacterium PR.3.49]
PPPPPPAPPPQPAAPPQPHIIPVKPAAPVAPSLTQPQTPMRPSAPPVEPIPVKPAAPQPIPQPLPEMQPAPPQVIPVRPQAPAAVAAQMDSGAIPVRPDPGLVDDDDLPVVIKPVAKPISESIPIRPDPIIEELLAPLSQQPVIREVVSKEAAAANAAPAMPHTMPTIQAQAQAQNPPHAFSQSPLEAPDPLFQATQQSLAQHSAVPHEATDPPRLESAEVKYNVFGIPIGPDEEPIVEVKAEEAKSDTNQAIVNEAVKSAARTHPGLPPGFVIPDADPAHFTLPSVSNSLFKARSKTDGLSSFEPAKTPDLSQLVIAPDELASVFAPSSDPIQPVAPAPAETAFAGQSAAASQPVAAAPEAPAAPPAKGKRGRKAKNAESANEPAAKVEPPPEAVAQPPKPVVDPDSIVAEPTGSIIAAAAAAAFGQLPQDDQPPALPVAAQAGSDQVDEEGFIIQTFVEPVAVVDPERTLALPQQTAPIQSAPGEPTVAPPPAAPPPPWHTGGDAAPEPIASTPFTQPQQPPVPMPMEPPAPPPVQPPMQTTVQQGQPSLLQQWSAKAKDHAGETPEPVQPQVPLDTPSPVNLAPSSTASASVDPTAAAVSQDTETAPVDVTPAEDVPATPPPPQVASHDHIVGEKYQTGAGEHHRTSWMEQGPTPNLSIPLPADYNPDRPQEIGAPVKKGPQRPQISPLYQESYESPVEKPPVLQPLPAPPAVPQSDVDDSLADEEPAPAEQEDSGGKKGKRAWSELKGGLSKAQRPDDAPVVHTNQQPEEDAGSVFPEVAARPMLPGSLPQPQSAMPPPVAMPPQQAPPPASFARGDDEAPHCPQCSALLEGGSQFCGECGYRLGVRIPQCVSCQSPLDPAARFCGECGTKVADATANGQNPAPPHGAAGGAPPQPADPEKAMEDYLSGFGPNQKDKHWSNKLKKILD